jgi:hypothetical protein
VYFSYHHSLLLLNLLRNDTSASVIQPLQTDALQAEEAADWIQQPGAPPSIPISPALPPQSGQASTSKQSLNNYESGNNKHDHIDPLAQFYGKARAQQKLKEDGVSVNHCLQPLLVNILTIVVERWRA